MKKIKKWRYYCDYCKKSGCSPFHMEQHEKHCTCNPNRVCRMCRFGDAGQRPIADLISALMSCAPNFLNKPGGGVYALREVSGGCPVCMLAAIRQSGVMSNDPSKEDHYVEFDFRAEMKSYDWPNQEHNW